MILRLSDWISCLLTLLVTTTLAESNSDEIIFQPTTISIIDLLSASSQHSLLIKALQRSRLIPYINQLNSNLTFFAPTDSAILESNHSIFLSLSSTAAATFEHDNLQLELRETLLYHLFNHTVFQPNSTVLHSSSTPLFESLHYPSLSSFNNSFPAPPTLPGSPPDRDDPGAPTGKGGLLRGEGQKVRIVARSDPDDIWIGEDENGIGGYQVMKGSRQEATHGTIVSIDGVLSRPVDLAMQIRTHPQLSILDALLPTSILNYISTASHLTLFAPTNEAWAALPELELRYLQSGFAESDLTEIFGDMSSLTGVDGRGSVGYLDRLRQHENGSEITTILGQVLRVSSDEKALYVNDTAITSGDIIAMNGVLHTVPSLILPPGALSLTAEKYLIALDATRFVSMMRSVNLSHYLQTASESYTILAPRDDVLSSGERWSSLPREGSLELKDLLQYHIISGKLTVDDLRDGALVGTELRGEMRKGGRQMLEVSVAEEKRVSSWTKKKQKNLGFGGVNVVAESVQVGNSIIYLISGVLELPSSPLQTALADIRLSTFVASIYAASIDKLISHTASLTFLIPTNDAFNSLGLVMKYLLLPSSRMELRSLLKYHIIDEIVYLDNFPTSGSNRFPSLHGSEIYVERGQSSNRSLFVHGPTVGGKAVNGETRDGKLIEGNYLTSSGVIHLIDQVELPPDLDIGLEKLLRGAKASTMAELIRSANLSWVLQRSPSSSAAALDTTDPDSLNHQKKKKRSTSSSPSSYIILAPSDKAFSRLNLTYYLSNPSALTSLLRLHIIPLSAETPLPLDGRPISLSDEITYPTLLDQREGGESKYGQVAFRSWGDEGWIVGVKGARGEEGENDVARVMGSGRATPTFSASASLSVQGVVRGQGSAGGLLNGGGVLLIDSVLIPYEPSWWREYGWIIALVGLGILLLLAVGLLVRKVWKGRGGTKGEYEPILEGQEED